MVDVATDVPPVLGVDDVAKFFLIVLSCPHSMQLAWRYGNHIAVGMGRPVGK
jgi:hypothetical protein